MNNYSLNEKIAFELTNKIFSDFELIKDNKNYENIAKQYKEIFLEILNYLNDDESDTYDVSI